MGNVISDLIGREALITKSLIGRSNYAVSLNKLRGLYSNVQNSLKSLTLNNEEFEEIFKCHCFSIWDNDANGLINPLEVIAGITMLSNTSSKDKFQCKIY